MVVNVNTRCWSPSPAVGAPGTDQSTNPTRGIDKIDVEGRRVMSVIFEVPRVLLRCHHHQNSHITPPPKKKIFRRERETDREKGYGESSGGGGRGGRGRGEAHGGGGGAGGGGFQLDHGEGGCGQAVYREPL